MKGAFFFAVAAALALIAQPVRADAPAVPGGGFPASRYESLWTKSPFAVATAEEAQQSSPDYILYGVATVGRITYASLVDRQNQDHFLISTDKPTRGLTLTSVTRGHDASDTSAVVQKDGQLITLKLEQAPVTANAPPANPVGMPGIMTPQIPMPGANMPPPGSGRPPIRIHRPMINLPPRPGAAQPPPPPPPAPSQ